MIQQITAKSVLSQIVRPVLLWVIDRRLEQSDRDVQVIRMQQQQLRAEERAEHERQVQLVSRKHELMRLQ